MCRCSRLDLVDCMPAANAFWQDIIGFATSEKYILRQFSRLWKCMLTSDVTRLVIFERVEEVEDEGSPFQSRMTKVSD
eukprot:m.179422 g.179422  ORF g.179422 m.179422 type:complete len:78 (+) comp39218_c0_seq27:1050-1283(+)